MTHVDDFRSPMAPPVRGASDATLSLKGISKEKCGHPSQKPLRLIEKLVACSTDAGDLVLDPFLGSGTTAVAAESQGRRWIGIEANADYISIIETRLSELRSRATQNELALA